MENDLKKIVGVNEQILYEGKPDKKCFIYESIFNPLLPFAIIWAIFDLGIMGGAIFSGEQGMLFFLVPFMLLHMMPVWIYLGGALLTIRRYQNTYYIVTDRAIYVSSGVITKHINVKPFAELSHINLHRGIFDQMYNVGDIIATSNQITSNGHSQTIVLSSISNYIEVYNLVNKIQTDIYSDIMYPNALRPEDNPGYNTKYKG